jgi:hypothetical protein
MFCLIFASANATFITQDGKWLGLNTAETSLDFSQQYPNIESIYIHFDRNDEKYKSVLKYYQNQKTDLGLSKNINLKRIAVAEWNMSTFILNCYLPNVQELQLSYPCNFSDDETELYLQAFPNLQKLTVHYTSRPGKHPSFNFETLVILTPQIESIYINCVDFAEFSLENLNSIAQLHNLKSISLTFNWDEKSIQRSEEIRKVMQSIFPNITIDIAPNPYIED